MSWQANNCLLCSDVSKTTVPQEEVRFPLRGKLSYCNPEQQRSEANTVVPGTLTSPVIRHVTAGLLSVTPCTVYFPQHVGGWRRKVGIIKERESFNAKIQFILALHLPVLHLPALYSVTLL